MKFEFYYKNKNSYELREIEIVNEKILDKFYLLLKEQIVIINKDIDKYSTKDRKISKKIPAHDDYVIDKKLKQLASIKNKNLQLKNMITETNKNFNTIICKHCKHNMYKRPMNVNYRVIGNKYFILDNKLPDEWIYSCEHCHFFERESDIETENNLIKRKNELLEQGYNWVPNKNNCWYHHRNEPLNKHPNYINEDTGSWKRYCETIHVKGQSDFIKITETNVKTGEIKRIR